MTEPLKKPSRLDLVRTGQKFDLPRTGRLIVGIEKIVEDPNNERKVFRNMEGLVASMKNVGLIEPITVTTLEDGRYQIITGHRRYRAARDAGITQIEVLIREPEDERNRRKKSVISNVQREDIGPVELAEVLQELLEDESDINTHEALARTVGKDITWVSSMLRILSLPVHLRDRLGTSQLSLSWESVARIARVKDSAHQEELVDALLAGATHREIRGRIQEHSGGRGKGDSTSPKAAVKPKQVYHTDQKATVIVQSENTRSLSSERVIAALQEALKAARKE